MTEHTQSPQRSEFDRLWSAWRTAWKREIDFLEVLKAKYFWTSTTSGERARLDRLQARTAALGEKCYRWLDVHSPRDWRSCVPVSWVCNELRFEDAVTSGPLSVVPWTTYGATTALLKQFAAPVQRSTLEN